MAAGVARFGHGVALVSLALTVALTVALTLYLSVDARAEPPANRSVPVHGSGPVPVDVGRTSVSSTRILVRFRPGVSEVATTRVRRAVGATVIRRYDLVPDLVLMHVADARHVAVTLQRDASVLYAEPDVAMPLTVAPNDPTYPYQWGLGSIGAPTAWQRTTGSRAVTVAVLDSGIALHHEDLHANIWRNRGEIAGNQRDDDNNGFSDDVHGWNFVDGTNDPGDLEGHGTHVGGIVGAVANNGLGVAGVNWEVRLMPVKVCTSVCYLSDEIAGLEYAVDEGAEVVNTSFGRSGSPSRAERDAIAAAGRAGVLQVAAAGNGWTDTDVTPYYPASYPLNNIISVAALDRSSELTGYSNLGVRSVDLAAPGDAIWSTLPEGAFGTTGGYGLLSGTSMAAPHVAGGAALLWAQHPGWSMREVRTRLITTVRFRRSLEGTVASCGELDLAAATDPAVPERARLCVRRAGTGGGTIRSTPAGIACGRSCGAVFAVRSTVTLRAAASTGSTFVGWSGPCTGVGTCTVTARRVTTVGATFRDSLSPGWRQSTLRSPANVDVLPDGSDVWGSFENVAMSADGIERATAIHRGTGCGSDTGGIYLERKLEGVWVPDGKVMGPSLGDAWVRCSGWGTVTKLSADGGWLLASAQPSMTHLSDGWHDRCAAFAFRRTDAGWTLDGTFVPPNADPATGIADAAGCFGWGYEGGISAAGDRVAIYDLGRVDVFRRDPAGWVLEQEIVPPSGPGCLATTAPRRLGFSADGATFVTSAPDCSGGPVVWIYARSDTAWTLDSTLMPGMGEDVSISADGAVVAVNSKVFERDEAGWQHRTTLSVPGSVHLGCPAIVRGGTRIVCGSVEPVGFNEGQGAIYVFDAAPGGWADGAIQTARLFAPDGHAHDGLTLSGELRWSIVAVPEGGRTILAPVMPDNIAAGVNPHDLVGYAYRQTTAG